MSHKGVSKYKKPNLKPRKVSSNIRPVIIGYGPSGLFAAVRFVEAGLKPIIIEKGKRRIATRNSLSIWIQRFPKSTDCSLHLFISE